MKLSIFSMNRPAEEAQTTAPVPPPDPIEPQDDQSTRTVIALQDLRKRVLDRIFILSSVLGILAVLANLPQIIQNAWWGQLILYASAVVLMLFFSYRRDLSYNLRGIAASLALFSVGVVVLLSDGLYGSGRVFLLSVALIAAMLGGVRSRYAAAALSIATLLVVGGLMVSGLIPVPAPAPGTGNASLGSWLSASMSFTLAVVTLVFSFGILLEGLEKSLKGQDSLMSELRRERSALERRVETRTEALERRLLQIRAAAEITRTISRVLDIDVLLQQVCELVQERFGLYYVGIFLIEGSESPNRPGEARYAVLAAGTGEAGRLMIAERHRLLVGGDSMIGWATANRQARIALDTGKEATRFNNPYLPRTRSELALPIVVGADAAVLQSQAAPQAPGSSPVWGQPRRPDEDERRERQENFSRVLGALTIQSDQEAAFDQDDIIVLQGIADGLSSAIENARLFTATQASLEEVQALHRQYLESAWNETRRVSGTLAYTYEDPSGEPAEMQPENGPGILRAPIRLRDQVIGTLVLEAGQAGRWTPEQQQLIDAVTTQAALALENARLLEETRRQAEQERATSEITSKLWTTSDLDNILRTVLKELAGTLNANEGWVEIWPGGEYPPSPAPRSGSEAAPAGDVRSKVKEAGDVDG